MAYEVLGWHERKPRTNRKVGTRVRVLNRKGKPAGKIIQTLTQVRSWSGTYTSFKYYNPYVIIKMDKDGREIKVQDGHIKEIG